MRRWLSYYHPKFPVFIAYMLQQVEYNPGKFLRWVSRMPDLTRVMHRQTLVKTAKARVLVGLVAFFYLLYFLIALFYLFFSPLAAVFTVLLTPPLVILLTYIVVYFAWQYIEEPRRAALIKQATKLFENHPGSVIAISGSYGKTTMKELLNTVLSESKKVAATPGNRNVPVSHAAWIKNLSGDEDFLLVEYGEGAPGDIKKLAKLTHPEYGTISGLAPNHLDEYGQLQAVAKDLLSLRDYVEPSKLFVDTSSGVWSSYDISGTSSYSGKTVLGWQIKNITVDYEGTSFVMRKDNRSIRVKSGLLGRHQVPALALAAALAEQLGLSIKNIEKALSKTVPFEHRMQSRRQFGAWIIDDTYNGSLEGLRAGLALLAELPAKRKIYVTPGLVDQGEETKRVHLEIGRLIAAAVPDRVVLMQNSVTQYMVKGLEEAEYKGELHIEADPLAFYTNLEHVVAAGDLVMMQNDWTDNYS